MKFLRFLSLAVSVILAFYSALPNNLSPFMRTAIFVVAIACLLLFVLLTTLSRVWQRMVGMACAILFVCLAFIPVAIFQNLSMAEIFGAEEMEASNGLRPAVEAVQIASLDENSTLIQWSPDESSSINVGNNGDRFYCISGGSFDPLNEYIKNTTFRNYWMGESQDLPYDSVSIYFTDGRQIHLLNSRENSWGISWSSSDDAEPEQLDGQWLTSAPVTELFDPLVLEEINAILGAS